MEILKSIIFNGYFLGMVEKLKLKICSIKFVLLSVDLQMEFNRFDTVLTNDDFKWWKSIETDYVFNIVTIFTDFCRANQIGNQKFSMSKQHFQFQFDFNIMFQDGLIQLLLHRVPIKLIFQLAK